MTKIPNHSLILFTGAMLALLAMLVPAITLTVGSFPMNQRRS